MQILVLDLDTGEATQLGEHEINQQHLQAVDQSLADMFGWDEDNKRFVRAAVSFRAEDPQTMEPIWHAL